MKVIPFRGRKPGRLRRSIIIGGAVATLIAASQVPTVYRAVTYNPSQELIKTISTKVNDPLIAYQEGEYVIRETHTLDGTRVRAWTSTDSAIRGGSYQTLHIEIKGINNQVLTFEDWGADGRLDNVRLGTTDKFVGGLSNAVRKEYQDKFVRTVENLTNYLR